MCAQACFICANCTFSPCWRNKSCRFFLKLPPKAADPGPSTRGVTLPSRFIATRGWLAPDCDAPLRLSNEGRLKYAEVLPRCFFAKFERSYGLVQSAPIPISSRPHWPPGHLATRTHNRASRDNTKASNWWETKKMQGCHLSACSQSCSPCSCIYQFCNAETLAVAVARPEHLMESMELSLLTSSQGHDVCICA